MVMTVAPRKKLNEKELGSLYLVSETPLIINRIFNTKTYTDDDIKAIHDSMGKHAPDMAMIATSLCGNMIAEAMTDSDIDTLKPLAAELKYLSVNTVEEVGRIWVDTCRYGIHNQDNINDIVNESADILCILASILMEVAEACTPDPDIIRAVSAALMYQAEGHADCARSLIQNADPKPSKSSMETIPLPEELQNKHYTDNVVTFTLFDEQSVR
jgi:hypothetical protein